MKKQPRGLGQTEPDWGQRKDRARGERGEGSRATDGERWDPGRKGDGWRSYQEAGPLVRPSAQPHARTLWDAWGVKRGRGAKVNGASSGGVLRPQRGREGVGRRAPFVSPIYCDGVSVRDQ